jgi:tetratricopeptide (TPR) repeat protein
VVLVLGVAAAAGVGGVLWFRSRTTVPPPPVVDTEGVDPAVAKLIEKSREAVLQAPRSASAWGRLGIVLGTFLFSTEALTCLAEAERLDPNEPRWPYFEAIVLTLRNPEEAIPKLRRAVELCGQTRDEPRLRLSETLLAQGYLDEAKANFQHLVEHDPTNPHAQLGLGRIALEQGRLDDSLPYLERAAADPRTRRRACLALAQVCERRGDEAEAARYREKLDRLPPDPPWPDPYVAEAQQLHVGQRGRIKQANQLLKQGSAREALTMLSDVVRDYPNSEEAWFSLGQALMRVGDNPGAERALRQTIALKPGFAEAHTFLGSALMRQEKIEAAIGFFRKAIELKSDYALAYYELGRCLRQQGDRPGAIEEFRSAVRIRPDYVEAYVELGDTLLQVHKETEASVPLKQALDLDPSHARAKQLMEELEARRKSTP